MTNEELGRIVLKATSPDTNTRLTHDEGRALATETLRLLARAQIFDKLRECMGYVQNSSEQTVKLSQDDATRTFHVTCGDKDPRSYFGDSLTEAINKAHLKESQE